MQNPGCGCSLYHAADRIAADLFEKLLFFDSGIPFCCNTAVHCAAAAQMPRQRPGIQAGNPRNPLLCQKILNRILRTPVPGHLGQLPHQKCVRPRSVRLHILPANAIISDQRIGHCHRLSCIRGIRQNFLVTGHGCIKNNFRNNFLHCTDGTSPESRSVGKNQIGFHSFPFSAKRGDKRIKTDPFATSIVPNQSIFETILAHFMSDVNI